MDVNNTRFHLIIGVQDWLAVRDESDAPGGFEWDGSRFVQLKRLPQRFPRGRRSQPLSPDDRRGAASDRFGSWYWIGENRQEIWRAAAGTRRAHLYWQPSSAPPTAQGGFQPSYTPPVPANLAGLAVTTHHHLLVGSLDPAGMLIFDLHSGGEPLLLSFPPGFTPFDLTATVDGGTWILDRDHSEMWRVDRYFRLCSLAPQEPPAAQSLSVGFQPEDPADEDVAPPFPPAQGFPLLAADPISVESLPDGSLLILEAPASVEASSRLRHYRIGADGIPFLSSTQELPALSGTAPGTPPQPVVGHDLAYLPSENRLLVVERDGNQAFAYHLPPPKPGQPLGTLAPLADYLPMHYFGSRAIAAAAPCEDCLERQPAVYYDVTPAVTGRDRSTRWVTLQEIDQPYYALRAVMTTPLLDAHQRDCIWHRLLLDACIPSETSIRVETRAGDDPELLTGQAFQPEPDLYLRRADAEIPYYQPFPGEPVEQRGTWELLFQRARGRFLQIRLTLSGNGRTTPRIQALRAWYPRFSYVDHYLPASYRQEPGSAWFMERLLANFEGFYSQIEGKIVEVTQLIDPRSAPPETLDWLGRWVGLVLDPLWARLQERRIQSGEVYPGVLEPIPFERRPDRRRLMIRFAMRLYAWRGTPNGLRFALMLLLDPCLEALLKRLTEAARQSDPNLRAELTQLGLPYPTPATSEADLEEILFQFVLKSPRARRVRLVERWQTRQGQAGLAGDPTTPEEALPQAVDLQAEIHSAAHRFSVLVPEGLSQAEADMVERIILLEKPAHTAFDVRRFWDYFRVGEARLGIDSALGEDGRFLPIILGRDYLSEGYLESAYPMNVAGRTVSDRDALADMTL